ncbi:hypothetical protein [Halorhabdus amylolytica]|uniref:hypothetical protein n=1 Tax=Halorhabdus amylolytica TaxID=2559573 RepID=UPI0010AAEEA1|nr:hypothetical protein [Halorhabdus amylolytica]
MTDWSQFVRYFCACCGEECINHVDAVTTENTLCRTCSDVLGVSRGWIAVTSEGEGEPAGPEAQRSEHPGPDRERQSRSAPARQTGSAPSRGDPEARAHPPNPEGEGGSRLRCGDRERTTRFPGRETDE